MLWSWRVWRLLKRNVKINTGGTTRENAFTIDKGDRQAAESSWSLATLKLNCAQHLFRKNSNSLSVLNTIYPQLATFSVRSDVSLTTEGKQGQKQDQSSEQTPQGDEWNQLVPFSQPPIHSQRIQASRSTKLSFTRPLWAAGIAGRMKLTKVGGFLPATATTLQPWSKHCIPN